MAMPATKITAYSPAINLVFELEAYRTRLPNKPYCADEMPGYLNVRPLAQALKKQHIQHNTPQRVQVITFDIDADYAAVAHDSANLPPPSFVCINPANRHAHTFYALEAPVFVGDGCNMKARNLLEATSAAMLAKLQPYGADPGFAGLIAKNPYSPQWVTRVFRRELFTLGELGDFCDVESYLNPFKRSKQRIDTREEALAIGRNALLFFDLRHWAYKAIRQGFPDFEQWFAACLQRAEGINIQNAVASGKMPLSGREIYATAKSVAKWVHTRFSESGFADYVARTHTPEIQAWRGRKNTSEAQAEKGAKGGKVSRRSKVEGSAEALRPWEILGIHRATYYRKKAKGQL